MLRNRGGILMKWVSMRRPSPSMVVALIALVVALGGTAVAAGLVNGDSLISQHSLSGNRLRNHTLTGKQINLRKLGTVPSASGLSTLPPGHSESGFYATASGGGASGYIAEGITFPQPLAAAIPTGNVEWHTAGTTSSSCPGPGRAARNHVCLYDNEQLGVSLCCIYDFAEDDPAADRNGFIAYWYPSAADAYVSGEWTVTAP